ncbi:MAG TPA: hypothetical protein VK073_04115 [Pseudogracilibacillus sp.]|nr:hypothetical protein [Pseudogracilibacillus sp.]
MTSLLLIVSFLLHAVLLITIYQLYQQLQQMKQTKENESQQIVQQFITEIKEENKHLQAQITAQYASPDVHENQQLKDESNMTSHSTTSRTIPTEQEKSMKHIDSIIELTDNKHEQTEVSFEGKVLQLYQQGFDVDQIAKQLNSGRTEVDLIIKLQSQ